VRIWQAWGMQLSAQEEYGLRCLLRLAQVEAGQPVSVSVIAAGEGLSHEYVARLMAPLRRAGLVSSTRGAGGGYRLSRSAEEISIWDAILALGGPLFPEHFCACHPGQRRRCVRATDCALRALWRQADHALRRLFESVSLADLSRSETRMITWLESEDDARA